MYLNARKDTRCPLCNEELGEVCGSSDLRLYFVILMLGPADDRQKCINGANCTLALECQSIVLRLSVVGIEDLLGLNHEHPWIYFADETIRPALGADACLSTVAVAACLPHEQRVVFSVNHCGKGNKAGFTHQVAICNWWLIGQVSMLGRSTMNIHGS